MKLLFVVLAMIGSCSAGCTMPADDRVDNATNLRHFLVFTGYPGSGHTLVGAIVDAHPNALVSHEVDVLAKLKRYLNLRDGRGVLFRELIDNTYSRRNKRLQTQYDYAIPGWSGRTRNMTVLGDKKGGGTTNQLRAARDPTKLLVSLEQLVGVPLKLLHVIRDPLDQIAAYRIPRKRGVHVDDPAAHCYCGMTDNTHPFSVGSQDIFGRALGNYEFNGKLASLGAFDILDSYHDDMVNDTLSELGRITQWLELPPCVEYERAVWAMVQHSSRRPSESVRWTRNQLARIRATCEKVPFLRRFIERVARFQSDLDPSGELCYCQKGR